LIGLDLDSHALNKAKEKLHRIDNKRFSLHHSSYKEFPKILSELGIEKVDGFLFDLGISSYQIDSEHRGFSYMQSSPLDMRFNSQSGITAKKFLNAVKEKELIKIIQTYAEIGHARKISKMIILYRNKKKMNTTEDLKKSIYEALDGCSNKIFSRVFQAIRIAVNNEIRTFKRTLEIVPQYLNQGGRVAVISFHSIEDRITKHFFKNSVMIDEENYYKSKKINDKKKFNVLTKKPIIANKDELLVNRRSRSAKLRVAELL
jgi:16S rRNA (cytosine1402-N4)-methyltransferase